MLVAQAGLEDFLLLVVDKLFVTVIRAAGYNGTSTGMTRDEDDQV